MAISGASRAALGLLLLLAACLRVASGPSEIESPAPRRPGAVRSTDPLIRVALVVAGRDLALSGDSGLRVSLPGGEWLGDVRVGSERRLIFQDGGVAIRTPNGAATDAYAELRIAPSEPDATVRINGRTYRGTLRVTAESRGLLVINELPIESYLRSVVPSEMGRRDASEREALLAQAVVSRTYAFRNLGRYGAAGYDAFATVSDQAYGGTGNENPMADEAVDATRGALVTLDGAVAEVFFSSTCGGRTEDASAAFRSSPRAHLRSQPDDDGGGAYCAISPRYRWREEWTGESLRATLARSLPAAASVPIEAVREVRDMQIVERTRSGRAAALQITLASRTVRVEAQRIREALRLANGEILRSTDFDLRTTRGPRGVVRAVAEGRGAGHAVGLCQWGSVGRARAGHDHVRILSAYFPGTRIEKRW